jgi:hypothetical protein
MQIFVVTHGIWIIIHFPAIICIITLTCSFWEELYKIHFNILVAFNSMDSVLQCNTEVCLCNHCCYGKGKYQISQGCVCILALLIQHANFVFPAPYCHLWPVWLYYVCPHYLINSAVFRKFYWAENVCLISSTSLVWNISHSDKNSVRYWHKFT